MLADRIFQRLAKSISSGDYAVDQRLPSENELSAEFEVSRPVVRDALKKLREAGLIYSRQGAGSFVSTAGPRKTLGFEPLETIADLQRCYEFRLTIEPAAAGFAAERRGSDDLMRIAAALRDLEEATERQSHREDADFSFHLAITQAANNQYFSTAIEALKEHIAIGMKFHGLSLKGRRGGLDNVLREHTAIFEAIRDANAAAARSAMENHIRGSRDRLFEGRLLDLSAKSAA